MVSTLSELIRLGRTLNRRAAEVLACFDRPRTSNGSTEAINGRLEHPRGSTLGFRDLTNYIARALLDVGGFRPELHRHLRRAATPRRRLDHSRPLSTGPTADPIDLSRGRVR